MFYTFLGIMLNSQARSLVSCEVIGYIFQNCSLCDTKSKYHYRLLVVFCATDQNYPMCILCMVSLLFLPFLSPKNIMLNSQARRSVSCGVVCYIFNSQTIFLSLSSTLRTLYLSTLVFLTGKRESHLQP